MSQFEDSHSNEVTPVPFPNTEAKLITPVAVVSVKRRNAGAVFNFFYYTNIIKSLIMGLFMDKLRLVSIVKEFSSKKVAVIGDLALDGYLFGKVERINPERPGYALLKVQEEEFRIGCAGNVAVNIASLGADVSLFGCVGEDYYGEIFSKECEKLRVKLISVREGKTILKQRAIEKTHNDYLWRTDLGENDRKALSAEGAGRILSLLEKYNPNVVVLSDYNKGVFFGHIGERIIAWCKNNNIKVVVDPKPDNIVKFSGATGFCPNIKEAREITGLEDKREIAVKVKELTNCDYSFITCGEEGMIAYGGEFYEISTKAKEVVDVTGAGDTVSASLALSLSAGASIVEASEIANHAAGIVVEKVGTASVSQEELIDRLGEG